MALGFTQAHLDALVGAAASGATKVQFGDRTIEYHTLDNLLKLIKLVQADLAGPSTSETSPKLIQGTFSKGGT